MVLDELTEKYMRVKHKAAVAASREVLPVLLHWCCDCCRDSCGVVVVVFANRRRQACPSHPRHQSVCDVQFCAVLIVVIAACECYACDCTVTAKRAKIARAPPAPDTDALPDEDGEVDIVGGETTARPVDPLTPVSVLMDRHLHLNWYCLM